MRRKRRWLVGWPIGRSMSLTDSSARHQHTQHRLTQSICSSKLMVAEKDASVDDAEIPVGSQVR